MKRDDISSERCFDSHRYWDCGLCSSCGGLIPQGMTVSKSDCHGEVAKLYNTPLEICGGFWLDTPLHSPGGCCGLMREARDASCGESSGEAARKTRDALSILGRMFPCCAGGQHTGAPGEAKEVARCIVEHRVDGVYVHKDVELSDAATLLADSYLAIRLESEAASRLERYGRRQSPQTELGDFVCHCCKQATSAVCVADGCFACLCKGCCERLHGHSWAG